MSDVGWRHMTHQVDSSTISTRTIPADLAWVTAQLFQHTLDPLAVLATVFAQRAIGPQGARYKRSGLVLV